MFKKDYKKPLKEDFLFDMDIANAVSAYDFTGAVPVPPQTEAEKQSYLNILNYSPEVIDIYDEKEEK